MKNDCRTDDAALYSSHTHVHSRNDDTASAEHRRKLEALFGGGNQATAAVTTAAPQRLQTRQAPPVFSETRRPAGRRMSEYRMRLDRVRNAREPEEIEQATNTFLAHHPLLPDDMKILLKVLLHPSERVVRDALGQISSLLIQGRAGSTIILTDRLSGLAARELEPSTRLYVEGVRQQLAALQRN